MENERSKIEHRISLENSERNIVSSTNIKQNRIKPDYDISSKDLEDLISSYIDDLKKSNELKIIEKLGGVQYILKKLKTSSEKGILNDSKREIIFGSNKIFVEPPLSYLSFLKESLSDIMIIILLSVSLVQIIIGCTLTENIRTGWIDGTSIIMAVLIVVSVESLTNYKKDQKFYELSSIQGSTANYKVIRNGEIVDMKSENILVGDIIYITAGEIMPADLLLLEGNKIKFDESNLTGESKFINKDIYDNCILQPKGEISPIILSGTGCIEGNGKALIIAVGERSSKGKIRRLIDNSKEEKITPLEEKLNILAKKIGIFALSSGLITFLCLTIRLIIIFISDYKLYKKRINNNIEDLEHPSKYIFSRMVDNFLISMVIITIALPEGLPMAVALTLAFSIKKLMDKKNLVRKMNSCETMGEANYICTDKTGTLTNNCLNVVKILTVNQEIELDDESKLREEHKIYFKNEKYWDLLRTSISINVDCHINSFSEENINRGFEEFHCKNKTDNAFINFLYRLKSPISEILKKYPEENKKQISFDSNKKRMSTYVKEKDNLYRIYTKGGAEYIKEYCKYYIDSMTGEKMIFDEMEKNKLIKKIENYNNSMLRTLYVCYKDINENEFYNNNEEDDINNLVFLAIFGIRDTIRKGVKEAVEKCKKASVNIIMVTGDNIETACSIARECNIIENDTEINIPKKNEIFNDISKNNSEINLNEENENTIIDNLLLNPPTQINGDLFYELIGGLICSTCNKNIDECKCPKTEAESKKMSKKQKKIRNDTIVNKNNFKKIITNLKVMARSKPIHKYALVLGLKELGYVVAVTGDGTNDAPALSKSDVGFSMFDGTDIAKESSDIILMDNNFASIITSIRYGRNIFDNLRKFLRFQISINLTACFLTIICSCIGAQTPIKTIQMLWIDLIMDSLACLTLATERPNDDILKRKPTKKNENLINGELLKFILVQSLSLLSILIIIYLYGPYFIKEQNILRVAENKVILRCYGTLPGGLKNVKKIIYGVQSFWSNKYEIKKKMVLNDLCSDYSSFEDLSKAYKNYNKKFGAPAHLSMIFNIFVLYTLFNQINCRLSGKGLNIFKRILKNPFFIIVNTLEFIIQIIIVQFYNVIFKLTFEGLTGLQWTICLGFSSFSLLLEILLKLIPFGKYYNKIFNRKFML